ncbi:AbiV family abortive infection protein [Rhodospirillum rubrum]|uniref:AbiV family abortive infection protein n=1 Tax=Rhodospirillum rubrum TaxID=1085 RepID=UPI0009D9C04C|nr:AbiV family abortive infection protein [Rhodospirillum rubrum]MBK5953494.1 hypothetical protein [Rhodospirillum rubrum]QXG81585.1 AbiV family abortive infection protein [Rhodospirillum rubrum]HAQ00469.1 AbiV family abortive infection protein [Rhodospirillum rubrum]HCF17543.1 AbiV family abortive infection protein [Rhodospirillum rubrum]
MAKAGQLEEYRGPITPASAAEGMNAARQNALRLVFDAKLLLEAERYPTAASVAALSIEESGKLSILRTIVVLSDVNRLRDEWRRYRDHRSKNGAWILPDLARKGARHLYELAMTIERDGEHTAILNSIKQIGFYTDCYGKIHWSNPSMVIDRELANSLVKIAEILTPKNDVTVRELELWVDAIRPVYGTSEMSNGLLRWATQMHREGLSDRTPEEYAKFVFGEETAAKWTEKPQITQ